ncbi:peptide alpha-N-acetyltransferase [Coleophoma crateriformis]|uniref:Peptide alpha-N-acetyltransferase n=1 Tax=Coleophoma crateriformis TaxID=565419 RepID=A0A3D8QLX9_9HELO|nr:peptide alpha-N-acetyltransferase [Coleophoma crateriformis]
MLRRSIAAAVPRTARITTPSRLPRPATLHRPLTTFSRQAQTTRFTFSQNPLVRDQPQTILQRLRTSFRSFHASRRLRNNASNPNPAAGAGGAAEEKSLSLGARMRKLSREYGWSALGVYLALSALDFPFCYLLVRTLGTDRIGHWEHVVVTQVKAIIPESVKQTWHDWRESMKQAEHDVTGKEHINDGVEMAGWGVQEATEKNKRDASLATQLALAYAIHKSFIFIRVPITAAITPKVVKVLRGWGWDIGKRTTKEAKALKRAAQPPKSK